VTVRTLDAPPTIEFQNVSAEASGHTILEGLTLTIEPGSHVAIVGPSGAGKSSFVGMLLGWLKPSAGGVRVNGETLEPESLRRSIAWLDPAVQLWNRTLLSNLTYGNANDFSEVATAVETATLRPVLETLPEGLQTKLGEGGALVSGGEGQRVRFGRAMLRKDARLAILDEPFRGLDRERRRELLTRAREIWREATMLCVTHDIAETIAFDRVLVIENGRVVEDGAPQQLSALPGSRYSQLLQAEEDARNGLWSGKLWRRVRIQSGRIVESLSRVPEERRRDTEVA
jgi:ATP-binding cassette subfamily B protein